MSDFVAITSDNRWFAKHPEKIAGVEFESTSFFFPIQIKGTKEDVLRVTGMNKNNNKLKLAKAKAKAILIQLQLNQ
jgi:hypothetical protein